MTSYLLFYFSFGVALSLFVERWIANPTQRILMLLLSLCAIAGGVAHHKYDEKWLEKKIVITLDDFCAYVTNKEPQYDTKQIPNVIPGERMGGK